MNRTLLMLATAGGFALAGAGAHADPVANWSGPYVGVNGGGNWGNTSGGSTTTVNQLTGVNAGAGAVTVPSTSFPSNATALHGSGFQGGGQLGFNVQQGPFVWGAEGDFDALEGNRGDYNAYSLPATGVTTGSTVTASHLIAPQWEATLRGRVGFAFDRVLLYGTGGAAWVNLRDREAYTYTPTVTAAVNTANPTTTYGPYSNGSGGNSTHFGWTAGAGADFMISPNITLGAEYRHTDVGMYNVSYGSTGANGVSENGREHFTDDAVLGRINFKFGTPGHWWF